MQWPKDHNGSLDRYLVHTCSTCIHMVHRTTAVQGLMGGILMYCFCLPACSFDLAESGVFGFTPLICWLGFRGDQDIDNTQKYNLMDWVRSGILKHVTLMHPSRAYPLTPGILLCDFRRGADTG